MSEPTNVIPFPVKGSSVDEIMTWLNERWAAGQISEFVLLASDTDGNYEIGISKMSAMHALYMSTYLHERVMQTLRDSDLMPRPE